MRDNGPCQHTLSDDVIYKDVVVIGNGPSGLVTSFMLAGNVPYLKKEIPEDLPIDEMLRARLSNLPPGQNLLETDLMELAEGLEGRSHNPIPLLMDNLLRPCADLGLHADSLIEWKYDVEKQIEHVVLGRGQPGGSWHTFPADLLTLSPAGWLALPPHRSAARNPHARLPARALASYCRRYVRLCNLQRFFRSGVIVTSLTVAPRAPGPPCASRGCPRAAAFNVSGYDTRSARRVRYSCARVVLACGAADAPNAPSAAAAPHALRDLAALQRLPTPTPAPHSAPTPTPAALVVGSGLSAADAVLALRPSRRVLHVHRAPPPALARLPPAAYPDYCQVYRMMCDGPAGGHRNYTPYPDHVIVDVTPVHGGREDQETDEKLRLKRVTLLDPANNRTVEVTVSLILVLIGSRPDLFFLQTNFGLEGGDCRCEAERRSKSRCYIKDRWQRLKSAFGQAQTRSTYLEEGLQSKSKYLTEEKEPYSESKSLGESESGTPGREAYTRYLEDGLQSESLQSESKSLGDGRQSSDSGGEAQECAYAGSSGGLGFGVDPSRPVDGRANPVAVAAASHELLRAPGLYALGPLAGDNFIRFIPGGALALAAHLHRQLKPQPHH
ncbi:unnamed protein product, partial [Iphiclides podalirius]